VEGVGGGRSRSVVKGVGGGGLGTVEGVWGGGLGTTKSLLNTKHSTAPIFQVVIIICSSRSDSWEGGGCSEALGGVGGSVSRRGWWLRQEWSFYPRGAACPSILLLAEIT